MNPTKDVLIIGAGIAGLTAAHILKKKGADVALLEKSSRAGGVIRSEEVQGHQLEWGPNTVKPSAEIMDLLAETGLTERARFADPKSPRYIWTGKRLLPVPLGPLQLLTTPLLSSKGKWRLLKEPWVPGETKGEESLAEFIGRRFGEEVADTLVRPFVSGIWAGNADHLAAASAFPLLAEWERSKGSVIKGALASRKNKNGEMTGKIPKGLLSFPEGLGELSRALASGLGASLHLNQTLGPLTRTADKKWKAGDWIGEKVILAVPADAAADFVQVLDDQAAEALRSVPYAPLVVAHLSFEENSLRPKPNGFGFLSLPKASRGVLGCLFSSSLFQGRAPEGRGLLTVFAGGANFPSVADQPEEAVKKIILQDLNGPLQWDRPPAFLKILRYPRAIPQYNLGHDRKASELLRSEERLEGLVYSGNIMGGVSVGDVIKNAKTAAEK